MPDVLQFLSSPETGLAGLFLSSFLAATLLPGGSEAVLFALLRFHPEQLYPALALATVGNTLGGMTTYAMARWLPNRMTPEKLSALRRWGSPALLLAWAPLVGDALCAAAGWLRLHWLGCALWMGLGKFARYAFVAAGAAAW